MLECLKAILFGIVEGITEWLPVSSTGHMILLNEFVHLNVSDEFWDMFLVVIQLGAIMAVILIFFRKIWPFSTKKEDHYIKKDIFSMWFKIAVSCVPAAVIAILFDDELDALFYNYLSVAIALIVFGIAFIVIENLNKNKSFKINSIQEITYNTAIIIGIFQLIAAVFPGTSRSGATILGALLIGVSRQVAAEFTFYLAIPVMFGASLLKIAKFGLDFEPMQLTILFIGMLVAFLVSVVVIHFLLGFVKKHDFKIFGWYRIVLGIVILFYFVAVN